MPPKKKGNKKAQDDWEADLGESIAPTQDNAAETPNPEQPADDDDAAGGGLMAVLQRRSKKKTKKGGDQDWVQGEDATADEELPATHAQAPQEATFDDEDDVFAGNYGKKKGKGQDKKEEEHKEEKADEVPRVKTKAEKEKEKKEKEKQRKKEMVCFP
jgi:translation initiation factor 5B